MNITATQDGSFSIRPLKAIINTQSHIGNGLFSLNCIHTCRLAPESMYFHLVYFTKRNKKCDSGEYTTHETDIQMLSLTLQYKAERRQISQLCIKYV